MPYDDPYDDDPLGDSLADDDLGAGAPMGEDELAALLGEPGTKEIAARRGKLAHALVHGETGVDFSSLALFAEPLFTLYEIDPAEAFTLQADPEAAGDDTLALLETARVLWAFFSLPTAERGRRRQQLAAQLVGEDPTEEDWVNLDGLVEAAEVHWQALLPEEIRAAQQTGHPALDFDALLAHPAFHIGTSLDDAAHAGYGPQGLSEVEARALFAQPLLDGEAMDDADAFEATLARADALWALAQGGGREDDIEAFAKAYAAAPGEDEKLRGEAWQMVARYRHLFPERVA